MPRLKLLAAARLGLVFGGGLLLYVLIIPGAQVGLSFAAGCLLALCVGLVWP